MKILVYDWALHTVGGGQKFNCKIAEHLSKKHEVDILTLFPVNKKNLEELYSVNLSKVHIFSLYENSQVPSTLLKLLVSNKVSELSAKYDVFFNADAQETVKPRAKCNIMYCHFFEPRWYRPAYSLTDFFRLFGIYMLKFFRGNYAKKYKIYCNSEYTKNWLKRLWHVESKVIYPPVDIPSNNRFKKQNLVISTGRIAPDKNYELVIDIFKRAIEDSNLKGYNLFICGKSDNLKYLSKLKELSKGLPIKFLTDLSDNSLKEIYKKSKIFIQAKGFGINEEKYPSLLEHFGMTTAEAMSHGAVPIVLNKGGYKETIENNKSGFLFNNVQEAVDSLKKLASNKNILSTMSKNARKRAKRFSLQRMQNEIDLIIA